MSNNFDLIDSLIIYVVSMMGMAIAYLFYYNFIYVYVIGMFALFVALMCVASKHVYDDENNIRN